ncbi:peptidyl-prolyl cis-trans isomerase [Desulfurivibrio alkaliphilus]|uniref:peptidylprolyl isomerase n=1 Tax=Desulfurivibrio alkaliphilus (strain DSM 19089 / UNIQEM U267 / AHT2) TaxID=589865 RepID=D6YZU7_DESAT|nr:peptidylprolyl isomerase [Desulfurivibrio alkaliphilus]ADH85104.1 hypothetical protein DaAHT2_0398 [Desulfurivibrio alkaliphilus AHT 2]
MRCFTSILTFSSRPAEAPVKWLLLLLLLTALLLPARPAAAWWWPFGGDTLLTIDGVEYSTEDFKGWWQYWNDEGLAVPPTPDLYIDWLLLVREAERMELAGDPSFQRQTRVFLTSRALLMLKNEAVNSRIKVTEADLKAQYEKEYLPRWQVERLHFRNAEEAVAAWEELQAGNLTVAELLAREPDEGGPVTRQVNWHRPQGIAPGWAEIFNNMEKGEVADPEKHHGGLMLFHLKEVKGGDAEDFQRMRESLHRDVWKEQEAALTRQLLAELRRKYQVEINEQRLAELDINAPDDAFGDEVLVATSRQNLTERDFIAMVRRDMTMRPDAAHAAFDEEKAAEIKDRVVDGFIAQSLTNWESLARGYEKREPFKGEYDFHVNHRLSVTLERRLFADQVKVDDDMVRRHYEENLAHFSRPAHVRLNIITNDEGPVNQVWAEVVAGKEFSRAVQEHFGRRIPGQEVPINHLDPRVRGVVEKLAPGETSAPFDAQGSRVVVHLIDRVPENPLPFERVAGNIRDRLVREKTAQLRQSYLDQLRARSRIEINDRNWRNVRNELGGAR